MARNCDSDDSGFARHNQAGRLVIKAALGDDIRCIPIHNEDITYDELVLMMQRVFRGKVNTGDDVLIKYKDEDGDLVTIFDSSDLTYAIHCSNVLKLTLFVNSQPKQLTSDEARQFRRQLQDVRNRINQLLDNLDSAGLVTGEAVDASATAAAAATEAKAVPSGVQAGLSATGGGREFDPLQQQKATSVRSSTGSVDAGAQNVSSAAAVSDGVDGAASAAHQHRQLVQQPQQHPAGYRPAQQQQQQQQQQAYMQQQQQPGVQTGYGQESQQRDPNAVQQQQAVHSGYAPRPAYVVAQPVVSGGYDPRRAAPAVHQQQQPGSGNPSPQHQMYGVGAPQQQVAPPGGVTAASYSAAATMQGQQPVQAGPPGSAGGYVQPTGSGYVQPQQQQQYVQQPTQGGYAAAPHGAPGANPYARSGPVYGMYPLPHGQYPPAQ